MLSDAQYAHDRVRRQAYLPNPSVLRLSFGKGKKRDMDNHLVSFRPKGCVAIDGRICLLSYESGRMAKSGGSCLGPYSS